MDTFQNKRIFIRIDQLMASLLHLLFNTIMKPQYYFVTYLIKIDQKYVVVKNSIWSKTYSSSRIHLYYECKLSEDIILQKSIAAKF